jgi:hypothetical protein
VKLSDDEKELLEELRDEHFGTSSVPLGEALEVACEKYFKDE